MKRSVAFICLVALGLSACGGASPEHAQTIVATEASLWGLSADESQPSLPELRAQDVTSKPVNYRGFDGTRLHVGRTLAPDYPLIDVEETYGGKAGLFYGSRHEHTDSGQLIEYLQTVSEGEVSLFAEPPTVHIGQDSGHRQEVLRAVQWLNETLPLEWHIKIGNDAPALSTTVPNGSIYVDIGNAEDFGTRLPTGAAGAARLYDSTDSTIRASQVLIALDNAGWHDESDNTILEKIIVHELLHSLGFRGHVDRQDSRLFPSTLGRQDPTMMLFPIDRQALFAAYERLESGDSEDDIEEKLLSRWSTIAGHFVMQGEFHEFGVSRQNMGIDDEPSFLQAWASGDVPDMDLTDSELEGEITWSGDLIGVRPGDHSDGTGDVYSTVTGTAEITVDLSTLTGDALFNQLETWAATVPGETGDGIMWGDGDLEYAIAVRGNTFHRVSGDDGILTGIFVGPEHEAATGTLERSDLTAAFGATR